jgi:hypothetical protein
MEFRVAVYNYDVIHMKGEHRSTPRQSEFRVDMGEKISIKSCPFDNGSFLHLGIRILWLGTLSPLDRIYMVGVTQDPELSRDVSLPF